MSGRPDGPNEMLLPSIPWESVRLKVRTDPYANIAAGGVGGALSLMVGFPLDTVKVRLQTMTVAAAAAAAAPGGPRSAVVFGKFAAPPPYLGTLDCIRKTMAKEGFPGFYRGMSGLMFFSVPRFALIFYGYTIGLNFLASRPAFPGSQAPGLPEHPPSLLQVFLAGAFSQLLVVPLVVAPCERIKVLLQIQPPGSNLGQRDCLKEIVRSQGVRKGLFRGTLFTYMRDIASFSVYFPTYEVLRRKMPRQGGKQGSSDGDRGDDGSKQFLGAGVLPTTLAGGFAGFFAWLVAIPLDVLKNRHQSSHAGSLLETLKALLNESGKWGLYRGAVPVLLRSFPANAATFLGYEATISVIAKLKQS